VVSKKRNGIPRALPSRNGAKILGQEVIVKINVCKGRLEDAKSQALILPLCEGENTLSEIIRGVDEKSGGVIGEVLKSGDFEGKPGQVAVVYSRGTLAAKRIALAGLGKKSELTLEKIRNTYARTMQHLREMNVLEAAASPEPEWGGECREKIFAAAAEGALLGLYRFTPYKTVGRADLKEMRKLDFFVSSDDYSVISGEIEKSRIVAEAVCFARDLVSAPANEMTPSILADHARKIAKRKKVTCEVLEAGKMKALGMNALLGVAAGSQQPPKLIIMEYRGGKRTEAPVALVGKGLTFDSGGISIKPAEKMDEMKTDMAGGAAVLAVIRAAADLNLPVNLVGLVPATENMPGGKALKPGDILKSYSGRTIEVINTDAEGRLILADALSYAAKYKPAAVIDIATLTGACIVALGEEVAGMLGTDDQMKKDISRAAQATGEKVWELPLWDHYDDLIKSDIADFKNTGGRMGGAITGAAFLSKFVGNYPWVHLDIAGPSWFTKDKPYIPKGASGIPVRTLMEYLQNRLKG
jgi:leucyl aminopeptidase